MYPNSESYAIRQELHETLRFQCLVGAEQWYMYVCLTSC